MKCNRAIIELLKNSVFAIMVILFTRCADLAGGFGSETTNGMTVSGIVYSEDGYVVDSTAVFIRSKSFLADTSTTGEDQEPDAFTNSEGYFEIDSVDTGEYYLELNYNSKQARLLECKKESNDEPLDSLAINLEQVAGFYGSVDLDNIDPLVDVYVQIYGLERIQKVDKNGEFYFSGIPEWKHIIRVITSNSTYGTIDQDAIEVNSSENRDVGTYRMPFEAWRDTVVVRHILDINGLINTSVDDVVHKGKVGRVVDLNLANMSVKIIPPVIGELRLRKLRLQNNRIDSLPDEIGLILSMHHLILQSNELVYIPDSFGNLSHLDHLDIGGNKLTELPESIINLKNLEFLTLVHNQLTSVSTPVRVWIDNNSFESNWEEQQGGE